MLIYNHEQVKMLAKEGYNRNKGQSILAAFIFAIVSGGFSVTYTFNIPAVTALSQNSDDAAAFITGLVVLIASTSSAVSLLYTVLVSNPLGVGKAYWFLKNIRGDYPPVGEMFSFPIQNFGICIGAMLVKRIFIALWSMLFVIPGIVKGYAYSMTEYIIADNPQISVMDAIRLSDKITQGYKGQLFYLDISFIGWQLLNAMTLGILGLVYVNPYYYGAKAAAYGQLKGIAIDNGIVT